MDVAFRNRDGSTALVVHNENDDPRTFAVAQGGSSFDYTLPGGALATFVWKAPLDDGYRLLDPPSGPTEAVDDDATTTWSGSDLNLDLGRTQRVRRVVVDAGTAAPPGPATLIDRRQDLDRRRRRPAHDVRHPGDAGAVPAGRLRHARDGRGRAYLPLRRKS